MIRQLVSFVVPVVALGLTGCGADATQGELSGGAAQEVASTGQALTTVTLNDVHLDFFVPPHREGDTEFGGNGPRMEIKVDLTSRYANELWVRMYILAAEDGGSTKAYGERWYHIFTAPSPILSVSPVGATDGDDFSFNFTDTGHALNGYQFPQTIPASRLVWALSCVGDTDGKESGSRTGCEATLHDLDVTF